jgi:hypothetical protein
MGESAAPIPPGGTLMQKTALPLVVLSAAIFTGALASHYVWPRSVFAQAPAQQQAPPMDMRAQHFTFVNEKNEVQAVLSVDVYGQGRPTVVLFDRNGKKIWTGGSSGLRPAHVE